MDQNTATAEVQETTAKSIRDNDVIVVKSLVPNVYYTCSKTLDTFSWADVGDTEEMTFSQLKVMKNKHGGYFTKKWLYPENDMARKKLGIDSIFAVTFEKKDMKLLYGNDVAAVKEKLHYIPAGERASYAERVQKDVRQGKIANVKIIRLLEKELGISLMDLV